MASAWAWRRSGFLGASKQHPTKVLSFNIRWDVFGGRTGVRLGPEPLGEEAFLGPSTLLNSRPWKP